jgi:hypothetical protein
MKPLITLMLLLTGLTLFANDTLTRQEIYDFLVNDTFEYKLTSTTSYYSGGTSLSSDTEFYSRYVIVDIFYSTDSSVRYIKRLNFSSMPYVYDTIKLAPPTGNEIELSFQQLANTDSAFISGEPLFFNQPTNRTKVFRGYTYITQKFARGLGMVYEGKSSGVLGVQSNHTTTLIYYSGSKGVMGTPYTNYPLSVNDVSNTETLSVYFTPDGRLHITQASNSRQPFQFRVYDVSGRLVTGTTVTDNVTDISVGNVVSGMYIWQAVFNDNTTLNGKVMVH